MTELQRFKLGYYILAAEAGLLLYQNFRLVQQLRRERERNTRIVKYFGEICNRNNLEVDPFDLIVLKDLGISVKTRPLNEE